MPTIGQDAQYTTFINTFRCKAEDQQRVVEINRQIVEQVASKHPGFVSASVHRSVDGTRVINYLQWRSAADLAAMQASPQFRALAQGFAGIIEFDPHECEIAFVAERQGRRPD